MSNSKISALTSATTPLAGTEILPIVQSSTTKKVAVSDLTAGRAVSAASFTATGNVQASGNIVSASTGLILKDANTGFMRIIGGTSTSTDPAITMYGGSSGNPALTTIDGSSHRLRALDGTTFLNVATDTTNYGNFVQGTAAKGINFTANTAAAGKTSQLLNWYEEGTFTPTYTAGTGALGSITYQNTTSGYYTRIGRQVFFTIVISTTALAKGTGSGLVYVTGLPFTSGASPYHSSISISYTTGFGANAPSCGYIPASDTKIILMYHSTANGNPSFFDVADLSTGTNWISMNGFYNV